MKFKPDVIEWYSCSDNSTRGLKCKHIWGIEFAIRIGTLKDTDKLPIDSKRRKVVTTTAPTKSYTKDGYSF